LAERSDGEASRPWWPVADFAAGGGSRAAALKIGSRPWRRRARIAAQLRLPPVSVVWSAAGCPDREEFDFLSINPPAAVRQPDATGHRDHVR
jgi:hypothetical protein